MSKKEKQAEKPDARQAGAGSYAENTEQQAGAEQLIDENAEQAENQAEPEKQEEKAGSASVAAEFAEAAQAAVTPEEKIAGLEAQLADIRDQLLRKAADFENFRKRMNQEKANSIEYANQSLLLDIIPVIDDFERAIQAGESGIQANTADLPGFLEGIKMIEKRLISQLESKWGLKRFSSAGEAFDPNRHEALMMEKSPDISEAVVQEDFQKGYMLKERVIRAAKVKVLMPEETGTRD
ncbi:MAG: nucleotide exchange factor GrpE [Treponema sp.]|jgi:molecular chaperone GrpE|nr:nucleotide exchange factor GrpE [Treponema sp.]